ncbi:MULTISPECIES: hypothetical protein [unclassified Pseudomonas]|uniref:hypothetical protein n=1 Tax=unclassified Pseudomonas TaxID=196821 RepID=UPI000CD231C3|nr:MULTISPECIES: hypothetical protein [unclassified Pseudomonas]POA50748.1 hypothetical protein C1889_30535 [Pseudomonas sp. FW507-12TSA]
MKTNHLHAFTRTTDTLALVPIFLGNLAQGQRAAGEPALTITDLAEVAHRVNSVIAPGLMAFVTPTNTPGMPWGAVVADAHGHVCATACSADAQGLADLIIGKLRPLAGSGEASP